MEKATAAEAAMAAAEAAAAALLAEEEQEAARKAAKKKKKKQKAKAEKPPQSLQVGFAPLQETQINAKKSYGMSRLNNPCLVCQTSNDDLSMVYSGLDDC